MEILTQFVSVFLVLGLLGAAVWWLRGQRCAPALFQTRRAGDQRLLQGLDRLSLSTQHSLHLVRFADRVLLVAVHTGGCRLLESRPWGKPAVSSRSAEIQPGRHCANE